MSLDRTSLSVKTSFQRRPAALNTVQRAPEHSRSSAQALQQRLGNRATQMFVGRSIARHADAAAGHGAGNKTEKSCSPGSCECADCKQSQTKGSSPGVSISDNGSGLSMFGRDGSAAVKVDRVAPATPTPAQTKAPEPKLTPTP